MATSASAAPADVPPEGQGTVASDRANTSDDVRASKVTKHVWRKAPSYVRFPGLDTKVGSMSAGNNYFYCQSEGRTHSFGQYENNWWLKTDDDEGNANVWVPAVYISDGSNYEPIPGVPPC